MDQPYKTLYRSLMAGLQRCHASGQPLPAQVLEGYQVSQAHWLRLKRAWQESPCPDESGQIRFFRSVKPRFTSYIEYYFLLNRALVFEPDPPYARLRYWQKEEGALSRFQSGFADFIRYLDSGSTEQDPDYFIPRPFQDILPAPGLIYADMDCRTSHDGLVRSHLAHQQYLIWVRDRLAELSIPII